MAETDFSKVGRNEPCPCGSGKKYKKCHYGQKQVQQQAEKQTAVLSDFIKPDLIPYLWFKNMRTILNRREWGLLYDAFHEEGALRAQYPTVASFVEEARLRPTSVPAGGDFELRAFRILDDQAFIMGNRGADDRRTSSLEYEVIHIQDTEAGYRIMDVEYRTYEKSDLKGDAPYDDFELVKKAYAKARTAPIERPDFVRWMAHPETGLAVRIDEFEKGDSADNAETETAPA